MNNYRRSTRLARKHIHPYVLCIIDMQPKGFNNCNLIILPVVQLVRKAIVDTAFIAIAQFKGCGETHALIVQELQHYQHTGFIWHNKNDKSLPLQQELNRQRVFVRELRVCGVNTEYCVKDTVHGLAKKYHQIYIKVMENACNGTDRVVAEALHILRTFYRNVAVI